jgi:small subunit ribosomal protein S8e
MVFPLWDINGNIFKPFSIVRFMAKSNVRSLRKATGGRYSKMYRKKKARDMKGEPILARITSEIKSKIRRVRGGNQTASLVGAVYANVTDGKKTKKVKIKTVLENPASRHFVRENIVTRGSVVDTEAGKARVTSRPSKDNVVNAVLVK